MERNRTVSRRTSRRGLRLSKRVLNLAAVALGLIWFNACAPAVPTRQKLVTTLKPALHEEAKDWPRAEWSVSWKRAEQLLLERHHSTGAYSHNAQLWVDFSPPATPKLSVRVGSQETQSGAAWYFRDIEGQCWISSDGTGLGASGGPDLAIQGEFTGDFSGSPSRSGFSVFLTSEQLLRK